MMKNQLFIMISMNFSLSSPCILQIIDEYNAQKKLIWFEYINSKFFEKDLHKVIVFNIQKMHELAVNLKEP